ncbi:lectin-4 [Cryptomeria japonica]|uniref:lectin-4 n=1 Tax=Cryptomeria japonica TaxID=3369 RepID=UPI0027DA1908|nr:lectin-4 [Cryptomeria japonica]
MANTSSLLFVCSCIVFAGVILKVQAESPLFTFPPATNFNLEGVATHMSAFPHITDMPFMRLSNGDKTQATFSWMTYNQPISLWDENSFLANFSSHFQFLVASISDYQSSHYGDGLAFFLAPFDSDPPQNCTGQWLGLFNQSTDGSSSNQIVAVEFDTLRNDPFDPDDNHVGIDVNSIVSKANVSLWSEWEIQIRSGKKLQAWVDYDGLAKRLYVFLTTDVQKPETPILSYGIDLTKFLPQKIKVGISASTAYSIEEHYVFFWDFKSHHLQTATKWNYVLILAFASLFTVVGFAISAGLWYFGNKSRQKEDIEKDSASSFELSSDLQLKIIAKNKILDDVYRGILPGAKQAVGYSI